MSPLPVRGWSYPRVLAHRGGGTLAPENTLAGLRLARSLGIAGVEFDAMLSADDVPVLMHDPKRGRTVPGTGPIDALTATQLEQLDAGSWLGPQWQTERVPRLDTAMTWLLGAGLWANVEIKPAPGRDAITGQRVADVVMARWLAAGQPQPAPLLSSFSLIALRAAQAAVPELPRALLVGAIPDAVLAPLAELQAVALHVRQQDLTPERLAPVLAEGYGVLAYTVNDPVRARQLLGWGVDAICTDRPDLIPAAFPDV